MKHKKEIKKAHKILNVMLKEFSSIHSISTSLVIPDKNNVRFLPGGFEFETRCFFRKNHNGLVCVELDLRLVYQKGLDGNRYCIYAWDSFEDDWVLIESVLYEDLLYIVQQVEYGIIEDVVRYIDNV